MEPSTSYSSSLIPVQSKKPMSTTPIKSHPHVDVALSIVTPDRVNNPLSRTHNQTSALSVSDVRQTALQLQKPGPGDLTSGFGRVPDQITWVGAPDGEINGSGKSPALLPQKHEMLCEFFNAMVSSIRLLLLKRLPTMLTKLSRNIESLTDRRFTLHHLAQLKHLMPEVIVVKKSRVLDEETSCMKEDLLISLETNAVETDKIAKGSGGYSHIKRIFHSRIVEFSTTHPDGDDIPEVELPEMFYKPKQEPEKSLDHNSVLQPTTLTAPLFKRRFSSRALSVPVLEPSPAKLLPESPIKIDNDATPAKVASLTSKFETPVKSDAMPVKLASTPVELVSTPARLMTATPALCTPKHSLMTDDVETGLHKTSAKRRALKFDENCDDVDLQLFQDSDDEIDVQGRSSAASKDLSEILPENLLHSLLEKERKTLREQDPIVSQAKKRQQLISGVPKLVYMITPLFQSIRRSTMTKEELVHKVLTGHLGIVDKEEVEEQLKLLQEIAPEFITEHSCLSGDYLIREVALLTFSTPLKYLKFYLNRTISIPSVKDNMIIFNVFQFVNRLNKSSCAESIQAKLLDAR